MSIWDKVAAGVNRAAKVAGDAVDEGKLRVAAFQARKRADAKAETLGYAVARARAENREPDAEAITRLVEAVNAADAEAAALERQSKSENQ
ncbi:MAG TPA: hypothetical protein VJR92_03070 [Gemmatimonadaceae bacterium]|nr:hypothetical protein [Gemmatimonadaceae bacterium]